MPAYTLVDKELGVMKRKLRKRRKKSQWERDKEEKGGKVQRNGKEV